MEKFINYTYDTTSSTMVMTYWCLTPLSTMCQLYRGWGQFYWSKKMEYLERKLHSSLKSMINVATKWCIWVHLAMWVILTYNFRGECIEYDNDQRRHQLSKYMFTLIWKIYQINTTCVDSVLNTCMTSSFH